MGSNLVGYSRLDAGLDTTLLSAAAAEQRAREQRAEAALRYLTRRETEPGELDEIKMMLGLIPSPPPPPSVRSEQAKRRARRQRERARAERQSSEIEREAS